jgi:hypothetical protein
MAKKKITPAEDEKGESKREEIPFEDNEKWGPSPEGMIPKEAVGHLMRAASEFIGAMDTMMPKKKMPDEVRVHYMAAKKEMMLMARSMIDAKIAACDAEQGEEEPRIKKIKLE